MHYTNLFYFASLNTIGGIETWFYNLSVLYGELDLTVLISNGTKEQIKRLSKNIRVIVWDGKTRYDCDNLFVCFNTNILPYINAKKKYLVLHGDYEDMVNRKQLSIENLPIHPNIDEYIGISELVCQSWERLTGIKARLCYNPVLKPKEVKTIRLCSAQRMSKEKGRNRIELMAMALNNLCENSGYRYLWDIYTNDTKTIYNKNINYLQPRLDIADYYTMYDWFVALSDNEGYCYSVVENLCRGVPCVVTDLPVFKEIGLNETNSLTLNLDLSNLNEVIYKMFNLELDFKYQPPKDDWGLLFGNSKSTYNYKEELKMLHKVEALDTYTKLKVKDGELDKILPQGFQFEVDDTRLNVLLGDNPYKKPFVKLIEEVKEEKVEEVVEEKAEEVVENVEEVVKEKPKKKSNKKK